MARPTPDTAVAVPSTPAGTPLARNYRQARKQGRQVRDADDAAAFAEVPLSPAERSAQRVMELDPQNAADLALRLAANPETAANLRKAAEAAGLPPRFVAALVQRLERTPQLTRRVEALSNQTLIGVLDAKLEKVLAYLDDTVLTASSARDLAIIFGVLLDKRQLLKGEPTQIVSHQERRALEDLLPAVVDEARRRGIDLTQNPDGSYGTSSSSGE
jgi:hypothetical protein